MASRSLAKFRILRDLLRAPDVRSARRRLLSSDALLSSEKALLRKVSIQVSREDGMYLPSAGQHYLSVGLSALRCIEHALDGATREELVRSILDFPCGYGRVLRFLAARFPEAEITASEIDPAALEFCKRTFRVRGVVSHNDFKQLSLSGKFDLIWCGSLITHVDESAAVDLLKFFFGHLSPDGVCVFTTHGQLPVERIQKKEGTYGLTESAQQELLSQFHETGYGYADYHNQQGYGISVVSHERMVAVAQSVGAWGETSFLERGWDNHQDVYCFANAQRESSQCG